MLNKILLGILLFFGIGLNAQIKMHHLHYRDQIENSEIYFKDEKEVHSSVKPILGFQKFTYTSSRLHFYKYKGDVNIMRNYNPADRSVISIYPITNLTAGVELQNNSVNLSYTGGLGAGIDIARSKFFISGKFMPYVNSGGFLGDSIQSKYDQDYGTERSLANGLFHRSELIAAYKPNDIFTFSGGYGKNFFGEGYRSLLLSDNAASNPFVKVETDFAGIKYVNLYNMWKDNSIDPFNKSLDITKFSAMHYLSWNITRDINLSIFETVVWQANDTITNRGFDFNYINPVVFYRPVEYGLGSSDNVLLGMNFSYKLNDHNNFYTQFVLDEFLLSEIKARSRWWANKYGVQVGYKSNSFIKDSLYFQLEFNLVRPFTYSHKLSNHAYGHMNASVTHPLGSNFMEVTNIVSHKIGRHRFTNKITFASYGSDYDSTSYGQDIFKSYTLRDGTYDHLLMQGLRTNILNESFIYEYPILPEIDMYLTATYNWRMSNNSIETHHYHTLMIGIKSRIWNRYNDL